MVGRRGEGYILLFGIHKIWLEKCFEDYLLNNLIIYIQPILVKGAYTLTLRQY